MGGLSLLNKMEEEGEEALSPSSRLSLLLQIYPTSLLCHDFLASPFLSLALLCGALSWSVWGGKEEEKRAVKSESV